MQRRSRLAITTAIGGTTRQSDSSEATAPSSPSCSTSPKMCSESLVPWIASNAPVFNREPISRRAPCWKSVMNPLCANPSLPPVNGWTFASSNPMPGVAERTAAITERTFKRSFIHCWFGSAQMGATVR